MFINYGVNWIDKRWEVFCGVYTSLKAVKLLVTCKPLADELILTEWCLLSIGTEQISFSSPDWTSSTHKFRNEFRRTYKLLTLQSDICGVWHTFQREFMSFRLVRFIRLVFWLCGCFCSCFCGWLGARHVDCSVGRWFRSTTWRVFLTMCLR